MPHTPPLLPDSPDPAGAADRDRVLELLPWYANGTLGADDLAFVERWMQAQPTAPADMAAELAWLRSTEQLSREAAQTRAEGAAEQRLVQEGLARLMAQVQADPEAAATQRAEQTSALRPARRPVSLVQRLRGWIAEASAPRQPAWALAAVALVVVQAAVIGTLLVTPPAEQVPLAGGTAGPAETDAVVFLVAFKPLATERGIRELLANVQGQLVGGPSALGLYRVSVPKNRADAAQASMREAASVVESAQRERP